MSILDVRRLELPSEALTALPLRGRREVGLCKRGQMRAARFLDAATAIFAEKGYQHAKLSDIVARAGGSLATLYRVFGDKEGLAHAILERHIETHVNMMHDLGLSELPPETALRRVASRVARNMGKTESLVVYRIVIGEGQSFPALRSWYFSHAIPMLRSQLTQYFQQQVKAGALRLQSPEQAASQFHMLLFGDFLIALASGYVETVNAEQLEERALAAVEVFLRGTSRHASPAARQHPHILATS
ncbi:TetR/AcrR family transcriptional regulator [Pseudoxanthomonas dokdonensis]|uniref:HTH tetR-type domain-containing protein n=1 Tax=Pseudoxanthomonas dokdonensis TaxID=344882 RepID=A0A0R0CGA9_9GAMM|nr:TetR/AcrR family transcriptional regulator [Pseudoxanthomonas dokdonensis]KRG68860.1 hypothetical protein ABB29_10295 [Pseudoxanthomonas dokdonensis]